MATGPAPVKSTKPARKRNRKRKRRAVSSSSSDSDSSSSDVQSVAPEPKLPEPLPVAESSDSSSSESSSESSSDSDSDDGVPPQKVVAASSSQQARKLPSRSPSPQPVPIPSFLPQNKEGDAIEHQEALKEKFRKFWMSSVVDAFKDDLEEIRKEPNLDKNRLALLIDSLASGGEVFSSSAKDASGMNEMEVVVGS